MGLFNPKIAPSREALRAAGMLGNQMARRESQLTPDVSNASRFGDFSQFRTAHREKLELSEVFRIWQERLFNIAEREGRRFALRLDDSMTAWDIWYSQIVQPMRQEMWTAWEAYHDLPDKYHAAAAQQRQEQQTVTPLHVAAAADTTHILSVASLVPSVPETPRSAPMAPARPTADPVAKGSRTVLQPDTNPALAMGSIKGIGSDNQISLDGDNWSI